MAEGKGSKLVYFLILAFSLTALGLAIAGERHRSIVISRLSLLFSYDPHTLSGLCVCERAEIFAQHYIFLPRRRHLLWSWAILLLVSTEALVMGITRCMCLGRPMAPGGSRACTITLFVTSWISYFMAEACLIAAAKKNAYHPSYGGVVYSHGFSCASLRKGLFIAGAIFALATMILNILYYRCFTRAINKRPDLASSTVGMTARV